MLVIMINGYLHYNYEEEAQKGTFLQEHEASALTPVLLYRPQLLELNTFSGKINEHEHPCI